MRAEVVGCAGSFSTPPLDAPRATQSRTLAEPVGSNFGERDSIGTGVSLALLNRLCQPNPRSHAIEREFPTAPNSSPSTRLRIIQKHQRRMVQVAGSGSLQPLKGMKHRLKCGHLNV